jgi:hypothetical protein
MVKGPHTMAKFYFSYLMRIWSSENAPDNDWYASLEEPSTQKLIHFKSIEDLIAFIRMRSGDDEIDRLRPNEDKVNISPNSVS